MRVHLWFGAVVRCALRTTVVRRQVPLTAECRDRRPDIGCVAGERRGDTGRMRITPFLLDRWLSDHQFATPPIEFDLAASTGPRWTWDELLSQLAPGVLEGLGDAGVSYGPAAGSPALREAIAEMAGVSPAEVVAVTGASEALLVVLLVAAEPGANVVLPHPGYPAFDELARYLGLEVRHYHLAAAAQHAVDVDELAARLDDRTAVVIVNTPHNPTGSVVGAELLAQLRDVVANHGAQLVVDEVYHPIYHGPATPSAATLAGATTIGDLSKALCLSGLRTGWIVEHDRARFEQYVDARSYLTISNSPIDEALAAAAIRSRDRIVARAQAVAEQNLATLDAFVGEHVELLGWVRPTGGLTAFPGCAPVPTRVRSASTPRPPACSSPQATASMCRHTSGSASGLPSTASPRRSPASARCWPSTGESSDDKGTRFNRRPSCQPFTLAPWVARAGAAMPIGVAAVTGHADIRSRGSVLRCDGTSRSRRRRCRGLEAEDHIAAHPPRSAPRAWESPGPSPRTTPDG